MGKKNSFDSLTIRKTIANTAIKIYKLTDCSQAFSKWLYNEFYCCVELNRLSRYLKKNDSDAIADAIAVLDESKRRALSKLLASELKSARRFAQSKNNSYKELYD